MEYMKCDNCGVTIKLKGGQRAAGVKFPKYWLRNLWIPALNISVDLCPKCQQAAVPNIKAQPATDCFDGGNY